MTFQSFLFRTLFVMFLAASLFSATPLIADDKGQEVHGESSLDITGLRIKAPIPGQSISAGYMNVMNHTEHDISIISVSSISASRVEMHTHAMKDGMMMMQKLDSVEVPAHGSIDFKEGGYHLMIFDPDQDALDEGSVRLMFKLSNGSMIPVVGNVEHLMPKNAPSNSHEHH